MNLLTYICASDTLNCKIESDCSRRRAGGTPLLCLCELHVPMGNSPSTPDGGNSPSAAQEGRRSSPDSSRSRNSRQWVQASQREAAHALGAEALQDQRADDDSLVGRLVGRPEAHAGGGIWESTGDEADDLVDILEEHALWPKDLGTEDMPFFGTTCPEEVLQLTKWS